MDGRRCCNCDRRARDHRADRRLAGNGWCCWGSYDVGSLTRQRDDATRLDRSGCLGLGLGLRRRLGLRLGRSRGDRRSRDRDGLRRRSNRDGWRCCDYCGWARRSGFGRSLGLFALQDGLESVAGFGDLGEVELRLRLRGLSIRGAALAAVLEVLPDPFGLIVFNRAGMGLSSHANCFERVQNWPALYFQFSCQIVDSNFAHPSLFASLRP
jgi:hypothetical protein